VPRPVKELKGFVKVDLGPGEEKLASVLLDRRSFAYYDTVGKQWKVEPGNFTIFVGSSSEKMELVGNVTLTNSDIGILGDSSSVGGSMLGHSAGLFDKSLK
jgi:beta-glucosidase